jgi:hypothetical protein
MHDRCQLGYNTVHGVPWFRVRRGTAIRLVTTGSLRHDELQAYLKLAKELGDAAFGRSLAALWLAAPKTPQEPLRE